MVRVHSVSLRTTVQHASVHLVNMEIPSRVVLVSLTSVPRTNLVRHLRYASVDAASTVARVSCVESERIVMPTPASASANHTSLVIQICCACRHQLHRSVTRIAEIMHTASMDSVETSAFAMRGQPEIPTKDAGHKRKRNVNPIHVASTRNAAKHSIASIVCAPQDSMEIPTLNVLTLTSAQVLRVAKGPFASTHREATIVVANPVTTETPFPCALRPSWTIAMIRCAVLVTIKSIVLWDTLATAAVVRTSAIVLSAVREQLATPVNAFVHRDILEILKI